VGAKVGLLDREPFALHCAMASAQLNHLPRSATLGSGSGSSSGSGTASGVSRGGTVGGGGSSNAGAGAKADAKAGADAATPPGAVSACVLDWNVWPPPFAPFADVVVRTQGEGHAHVNTVINGEREREGQSAPYVEKSQAFETPKKHKKKFPSPPQCLHRAKISRSLARSLCSCMRRVFSTARKVASDVLYDLTAVEGLARCCASLLLRPGCPGTVLVRARRLSFVLAHRVSIYLSSSPPPSAVSKVADPLTERAPGCRAAFVAALERRGAAVTVAALPPVPLSVRSVSKGPLDCPP
jgi:hypothetical protein